MRLEEDVKTGVKLTHFLRACVSRGPDGTLQARLTGIQSSGALTSMVEANALLIVPENVQKAAKGSELSAMMLDQSLDEAGAFGL